MATPCPERDDVLDLVMPHTMRGDNGRQRRGEEISVNSSDARVTQRSTNSPSALGRVLVVDADTACQMVIAEMLTDEGFAPLLCPSVDEAVEVTRRSRPDAVIVDPRVGPDTTAMTILDQIKHDPSMRAIPIIVCSADDDLLDDHVDTFQRYRCQIIPKPFDIDALLDAVHAVIMPAHECDQTTCLTLA